MISQIRCHYWVDNNTLLTLSWLGSLWNLLWDFIGEVATGSMLFNKASSFVFCLIFLGKLIFPSPVWQQAYLLLPFSRLIHLPLYSNLPWAVAFTPSVKGTVMSNVSIIIYPFLIILCFFFTCDLIILSRPLLLLSLSNHTVLTRSEVKSASGSMILPSPFSTYHLLFLLP